MKYRAKERLSLLGTLLLILGSGLLVLALSISTIHTCPANISGCTVPADSEAIALGYVAPLLLSAGAVSIIIGELQGKQQASGSNTPNR